MKLNIEGKETIGELKEQFSNAYPMLKIEFFHHEHQKGEGSPLSDKIGDEERLDEVRKTHSEGVLNFDGDTVIADFESAFHERYGLNVQVFRKSGNIWLEIISTDNRSLAKENEWAEELSRPVND
jgi:hypothetical protein